MFKNHFRLDSQHQKLIYSSEFMSSKPLNVNEDEIAKFERIASQWWDLTGDFKPLHQINPLRVQFISQHLAQHYDGINSGFSGKKIIDVGCGGGILSESLAKLGAKVTGIDMGTEPLNVAKLHALESAVSVTYQKITAEEKAQECAEEFDMVTCMEMLEHVPDPASVIQACSALVKPGGLVFFSTLNKNIKSYLLAIIAAEKLFKIVPQGTHDHDKFIRPSQLISWAEENNLKCIDASGIHYNPITGNHKLNDSLDVNYILCFRKL